jgi:tRNA 2-thiouridine synthesizing protein A
MSENMTRQSASQCPARELDARGLRCPEPVMMLHKAMRELGAGEVLRVVATDPTTLRDVPQFCRFLGHELLAQDESGEEISFLLRKGGAAA